MQIITFLWLILLIFDCGYTKSL